MKRAFCAVLDENPDWLYSSVFEQFKVTYMFKVGIGQDSHRFLKDQTKKPCVIGGVVFSDAPGMDADSDGDVVLHALCNAITSIIHTPLLGDICIKMCKKGITDSQEYVKKGLELLKRYRILHIAFTIEGLFPKFQSQSLAIRKEVSKLVGIEVEEIGITFTSGDGLTEFGKGEGLMCYCILTVEKKS